MMFETYVGALRDESAVAYLRPETAQGMFVDFKAIVDTGRVKIPFGIAQIGKSFRNEITPRNFIFRSREFEQMEMEYFIPDDDDWAKWHRYWIDWCRDWLVSVGIPASQLSEYNHPKGKTRVLLQRHDRFDVQISRSASRNCGASRRVAITTCRNMPRLSGQPMEYFDDAKKKRYVPHVIEPAVGVDRILLAILCSAYCEDQAPDEKGKMETRVVLSFAPAHCADQGRRVPVVEEQARVGEKAQEVRDLLRPYMKVFYDEAGAIGRRYRRQDEVGTPFCVTIDFDTLGEKGPELADTVTLRERDTMKQERIKISELVPKLIEKVR